MPNQDSLATIMEPQRPFPTNRIVTISGGGARSSLDVLPVAEALVTFRTMHKPFTPREVLAVVRDVLEHDGCG